MYNFLRKLFRHLTFDIEIRDREREGGNERKYFDGKLYYILFLSDSPGLKTKT